MVKTLKFYQCKLCGKIIELLTDPFPATICCGTDMVELIPNHSDGAIEKHVPVVTISNNIVHVEIGSVAHPMTDEHSIEWILVHTNKGAHRINLKPHEEPKAEVALVEGEKPLSVFAYCNLHGLWEKTL